MTAPKTGNLIPKTGAVPVDPTLALREVLSAAQAWAQTREVEKTKRAQIAAWERTTITEIRAKAEIVLTYLDRSFDERERNFAHLFGALDKAMADGGDISMILGSITALAAKSPFADLHDIDLVKANLSDLDHEWEV